MLWLIVAKKVIIRKAYLPGQRVLLVRLKRLQVRRRDPDTRHEKNPFYMAAFVAVTNAFK